MHKITSHSFLCLFILTNLYVSSGCGYLTGNLSEDIPISEEENKEGENENEPTPTEDEVGTLFLNPTEIQGYAGEMLRIDAMVNFTDENRTDEVITGDCEWRISPETVAVIDSPGVVLALSPGDAVVTVTYGDQTQTAAVSILELADNLDSLTIDPAAMEVPVDFTLEIKAMGLYSNGQARNLTESAQWSITDETIAQIENGEGGTKWIRGVASGSTQVKATFGDFTAIADIEVEVKGLLEVEIVPDALALPVGVSSQLNAIGIFDDGSILDISTSVIWSSGDPGRATISNEEGQNGIVTALGQGEVIITATSEEDNISGDGMLTVTAAEVESLTINPALPSLPTGATLRVQADAVMSGGQALETTWEGTWSIADEGIAVIRPMDDGRMLVEGISPGTTALTHSFGGTTVEVSLEVTTAELVSLEIWPQNPQMPLGTSQAFYTIGTYTDNTRAGLTAVSVWTSTDPSIAFVGNTPEPGFVSALAVGTVEIQATIGNISVSTTVDVTDAEIVSIQMHPPVLALPAGDDGQVKAYAVYSDNSIREVTGEAAWSIDDVGIAVVSNADGQRGEITALNPGEAVVTASFATFTDQTALTITDAPLENIFITGWGQLETTPDRNEWLTAIGMYANGSTRVVTDRVTWSSSDTSIAQISNLEGAYGRLTAVAPGEVTITAELDGKTAQQSVLVIDSSMVDIGVWPTEVNVTLGLTRDINAYGIFSQEGLENWLTWEAVWTSSDETIATVGNWPTDPGVVFGVAPGTVTITASYGDFSAECTVTVRDREVVSIEIGPNSPTVPPDRVQQFVAIASFDQGPTMEITGDVVWSSSDSSVAAAIEAYPGIISTSAPGEVTISATLGDIVGTTTLTVEAATPQSVLLSPISPILERGGPHQFYATAIYEGDNTSDVTGLCTWTSSDTSVLLVFDEGGAKGRAYGLQAGTSTVTANCLGFTATTSATVY